MDNITPTALGYRLCEGTTPSRGIMLLAVLESWCVTNCTGGWRANCPDDACLIELENDEDLILFMMSREYGYMGRPPITKTI